jgi:hypothetical protein
MDVGSLRGDGTGGRVEPVSLSGAYLPTRFFLPPPATAAMEVDEKPLHTLPLPLIIPAPPAPEDYAAYRDSATPIVIDNGASNLRFGYSTMESPRVAMNAAAKYKERRTNKPLLVFGEAIETDTAAKSQIKTPWEGDVLLNFDALVMQLLRYWALEHTEKFTRDVGKRPRLRIHQPWNRCSLCGTSYHHV